MPINSEDSHERSWVDAIVKPSFGPTVGTDFYPVQCHPLFYENILPILYSKELPYSCGALPFLALQELLQAKKLKIKKSTLERFLEECDSVAPWFAVSDNLTVPSWEKLGRDLDFAYEQGTLRVGVRPVWNLVRGCLEDQRCSDALECGKAALEQLQEEQSEKVASEKGASGGKSLYPNLDDFEFSEFPQMDSKQEEEGMSRQYLDWRAFLVEYASAEAAANLAAGNGVWDRDMLLGLGRFANNQTGYPPEVYQQVNKIGIKAWKSLPNKGEVSGNLTKILQSPTEPFSDFVARLVEAAGRIFGDPHTAMPLIKQLVYEQCTKECRAAITPYKSKGLEVWMKNQQDPIWVPERLVRKVTQNCQDEDASMDDGVPPDPESHSRAKTGNTISFSEANAN
ncbi:hypothetical protein STEG23_010035 [Scotinomys teguina]